MTPFGMIVLAAAGQLTLSWGNPMPSTATGIIVERSEAGNVCLFAPVATLPLVETWVDTPVAAGQTWCYRVLATDGTLTSQPSNVACGTPTDPAPPTSVSQTFTRISTAGATFTVAIDTYTCTRAIGGTAEARISNGTTVIARKSLSNPQVGVPFTITCALSPTLVTWSLNGAVVVTAPR